MLIVMLIVADMAVSVTFYTDGLGFRMTKQWTPEGVLRWCWLEREGAALMLQARREDLGVVGRGVTLYVMCDDALAFYREVRARGVAAKRPFVGNGLWVTGIVDPDGYRLDFESPTDVAEETEYQGE